ncbi:hypothetical protein GCM10025768_06900 [Microbacterium pseudoresistens]|uniref:DUF559 domain-containing protein n=1 Tax=Microbacterium pseudoresistens TaxID=640634 RepID=A0A7Y9EV43_9MICO|nr:hypothetical protein [Microbacterium pseudoresistens]NYD54527.1 hypothetical protein [Microbacterium pseudoresistens]
MRRAPLPPSLGSAFTIADAQRAGVTAKRLRRPELLAPFPGVRMQPTVPGDDDPLVDDTAQLVSRLAAAYALRAPAGFFFVGSTAAAILGIPLPRAAFPRLSGVDDLPHALMLEVATWAPRNAPRGRRIRGQRLLPALAPVRIADGMPVIAPASLWASMGDRLDLDDLVALGDAIVRHPRIPGPGGRRLRPPLADHDELRAAMTAGRRRGSAALRTAHPLIRVGSASRPETHLRLLLTRDTDLPQPALDVDVSDRRGAFLGCSELAYPRFRVAVEYEGDYHRVHRDRWNRDIDKYQRYGEAGWRIVRITRARLYREPAEALRRVRATLRAAGWTP